MDTPGYTAIAVERRGAADWVTLSRPERLNALGDAMVDDGLVSEVVPDAGPEAAGQALVDDMLATSPLGRRLTKEALAASVDEAIALEDRNQVLCAIGGDAQEGRQAFIEKRPPRFGRDRR